MATTPFLYSFPIFLAGIFFVGTPPLNAAFWWSFMTSLPLEIIAILLYMESIRSSPLSLTIPYLAFTPAFMLLSGHILLQETPNMAGVCGIMATVTGSYILNWNPSERGFFSPLTAVLKEKGSWMMLIVAMIYSITSVLGKKAIMNSSPLFFGFSYCIAVTLAMVLILRFSGKISLRAMMTRDFPNGCIVGLLYFLEVISHNMAMATARAAYMIAVKRLSIVFSVLYGRLLFRERRLFYRLSGALLMACGAIVISVWGK